MTYTLGRRDTNEAALMDTMRALCPESIFIQMVQMQRHDLVWTTPYFSEHIEVKKPGRYIVTEREMKFCAELEAIGRRLWILQNDDDVRAMWQTLTGRPG